jgi:ubiquinone/menaquinone biosynthesis C-methylase UbiE
MDAEALARSFGNVADSYERGRPRYPTAALDHLTGELELGDGSTVVDLAAGTGKLTQDLVPRFGEVIAVEPLVAMRRALERNVPGARALNGTAEAIPLADDTAAAVFVAQAFHWFANPVALAEIARVLEPRGGLALLFNTSPWERRSGPWFSALNDVLEARADLATAHRHMSGWWLEAFDGDSDFAAPASTRFSHEQRLEPDGFVASLASRSYVATLPGRRRAELLDAARALLEREDAPISGGELVIPLETEVYWTRKDA